MKKYKLEIERIKELSNLDLSVRENQKEVLSLIENLCIIIMAQNEQIQELEGEINRIKGEKGKPKFTKRKEEKKAQEGPNKMEKEEPKNWSKSSKSEKVKIDRTETVKLDKKVLAEDAVFKGYEEKTIQNILIKTDNVLYRLEKYYSPSASMTYTAQLPESLQGTSYGAETKALISTLYYENRVT